MEPIFIDIPKHGEDAPPYASNGVIIVCDGLGSGNQIFEVDGQKATNAYFASRETSRIVSEFLGTNRESILDSCDDDVFAIKLRETIIRGLKEYSHKYGISLEKMGLSGSTIRTLPTTLASMVYGEKDGKITVVTFWVGDSRCYCLDPEKGLMQLTKDDGLIPQDAMESLIDDSPMNNVINISMDFHVNCARYVFDKPCLLMSASDGMFGYLLSPMHFEYEFLPKGEDFNLAENIIEATSRRHIDDCTLACVPVGIESMEEYVRIYAPRTENIGKMIDTIDEVACTLEKLRDEYREAKKLPVDDPANIETMDRTKQAVTEEVKRFDSIRIGLWKEYCTNYYPHDIDDHAPLEAKTLQDILSEYELATEEVVEDAGRNKGAESPGIEGRDPDKAISPEPEKGSEADDKSDNIDCPRTEHASPPEQTFRRLELEIPPVVERMANTISEIYRFSIKVPLRPEYGFLYSPGTGRYKKREKDFDIYLKPASNDDMKRVKMLSSNYFYNKFNASLGIPLPIECGMYGGFVWMAYAPQRSPIISIDMVPSLAPGERVQILLSVTEILMKLHSSGYIIGSVSPDAFWFIRSGDSSCYAVLRNMGTISDVRDEIKADAVNKLDKNYDLMCLGMLICEMYAGKRLGSISETMLSDLMDAFHGIQDTELLRLAGNILFGEHPDLPEIISEIQRVSRLKSDP